MVILHGNSAEITEINSVHTRYQDRVIRINSIQHNSFQLRLSVSRKMLFMLSLVISNLYSRMGRIFLLEILRNIMQEISHHILQVLIVKCLSKISCVYSLCEYKYIMQYED